MMNVIKDFPSYSIGRDGTVMSLVTHTVKTQTLGKNGYYVTLYNKGFSKKLYVHRLLAESFLPNEYNKRTVNHINGIKTDNRLENLEWATDRENLVHALKTGLRKPKKRKLSQEEIKEIYLEFKADIKVSLTAKAKEHKVSVAQLSIWVKHYAIEADGEEFYKNILLEKIRYRANTRKSKQPQRLSKAAEAS